MHGLHGEELSHRFGNIVAVFGPVNGLLCEHLDLGSSAAIPSVSLRLLLCTMSTGSSNHIPILEPDLDGAFRHVDLLRDAFSHGRRGRGILGKLMFQRDQLILGGPLPLLVLLLLGQGTLPRRSSRRRGRIWGRGGGCVGRHRGRCRRGRRGGGFFGARDR